MARLLVRLCVAFFAVVCVTVAPSSPVRAEGPWTIVANKRAYGGKVMQTMVPGAVAAFEVQARKFSLWYLKGPRNGRVAVYLNGARIKVIDQWASSRVRASFVIRSAQPVNVVMLVALGTSRPKSNGTLVTIDRNFTSG